MAKTACLKQGVNVEEISLLIYDPRKINSLNNHSKLFEKGWKHHGIPMMHLCLSTNEPFK